MSDPAQITTASKFEPFPCCGVSTLGEHQDNVHAGTCTHTKLRDIVQAMPPASPPPC